MKVKELIARLATEDPEMKIVVNGYETGFDELENAHFVYISPNLKVNEKPWGGEFNEIYGERAREESNAEVALCLPRKKYR